MGSTENIMWGREKAGCKNSQYSFSRTVFLLGKYLILNINIFTINLKCKLIKEIPQVVKKKLPSTNPAPKGH